MPIKTLQDESPTLNLTPMIDVVFTLIIFFMVGTRFAHKERKIDLQLPQVGAVAALTAAPEKRTINVYRDGSITLDRHAVTLAELEQQLRTTQAQYAQLGVTIRGDADGPFRHVADVLSTCRSAGIEELGIVVRLADRPQ